MSKDNYLRLQTAYALEELPFPDCLSRLGHALGEKVATDTRNTSEAVNVARRMAHIDLFAWHIRASINPGNAMRACALISSYMTAHFSSCKALFDPTAIFLNKAHSLSLPLKQQDFRLGVFWTSLKAASREAHDRYRTFYSLCAEVVRWRDAAIHRTAPLAILHLTQTQRDAWLPHLGSIKVPDDPDWYLTEMGAKTIWLDPLDKHTAWRPRFLEICDLVCNDQLSRL